MTRWLAISNRDNSDVVIRKNIWGVPKRHINQISRTKTAGKEGCFPLHVFNHADTTISSAAG